MSEYKRQWYANNRAEQQARARARVSTYRQRNRAWLLTYLNGKVCQDCGHTDIRVLEFDHIADDKAYNVADIVAKGGPLERLQAEVEKCELVCCNCHHLRTCARRGDSWHNNEPML